MHFAQVFLAAILLQVAFSSPVPFLKPLSKEQAKRLMEWTPESHAPMWELSGQYQGDMVLTPSQRNGLINTRYRWPNREIPYEFSESFTQSQKDDILKYLDAEYNRTCVTVRPRTSTDSDYVYITGENSGCWSYVGRIGGKQVLNLDKGCIFSRTVVHEMLHAAGFEHQQSQTDRDDWVTILWENIQDGYAYAFDKYGPDRITSFGEPYDYKSVMHYSRYAFSKNGNPTILPTRDPNATIGLIDGLSDVDIIKLNKMYNCTV